MIRRLKPERHRKGWGEELWITNNDRYCGKLLIFSAGKQCSLHYHPDKHETWYVLSGQFVLTDENSAKMQLLEGDVIEVPPGCPHRLYAARDSVILEVSTPHREADSIRLAPGDSQAVQK